MLKFVLIGLAVVIIVLLAVVAWQPAAFTITRSATIAAPPDVVFAQFNDFHRWEAWSPWAKMDPSARNSFAGSPSGVGSTFAWAGNSKVGEGSMTITESRPHELIRLNLEFLKPFAAKNVTEFTFRPDGSGTTVTWSMSGRNGFMAKAFGLVINCDKMVGGQFEQGLTNVKHIVEQSPAS